MNFHWWLNEASFDSATLLKEMRKQTPSALSKIHKTFTFIIENNLQNVDGSLVSGNNTLVHALALNAVSAGRTLASAAEGVALYRRV